MLPLAEMNRNKLATTKCVPKLGDLVRTENERVEPLKD